MAASARQIGVTTQRAALAEAVFEAHGAQAVTVLDAGWEMTVEHAPHAQPCFALARVVGLFSPTTDPEPIAAALRAALGAPAAITDEMLGDRDWCRVWRSQHPPLRFGKRLLIAAHGAPIDDGDATAVVRLDPGLAFGTGAHASTALCLEWLAHAELAGARVLDYGCGSGILALAAARLGAAFVTATDNDGQALRATRENAAHNALGGRIDTPEIDAVDNAAFDIILANILAQPLIDLAGTLTALAAPGARLVLSGLLTRHIDPVVHAYQHAFSFSEPAIRHDWVRLDGRRRPR